MARRIGTARNDVRNLLPDLRAAINNAARQSAVEIMNGLAKAGPVWSGEFRDNWVADPLGSVQAAGSFGQYPYTLDNVAVLKTTIKETGRVTKFEITNLSDHAEIALDLKQGYFYPNGEPVADRVVVSTGSRPVPGFRGDVSGSGNRTSSAPLDWYKTYIDGGAMQKDLANGVRLGFKP
jgi:hypothetical protein